MELVENIMELFDFDGSNYVPKLDQKRLSGQRKRLYDLMKDSNWRTLSERAIAIQAPEASISAGLRDFRKERNGSHTVDKRRRGEPTKGWWEYRLILNYK